MAWALITETRGPPREYVARVGYVTVTVVCTTLLWDGMLSY